jgi:hypothetical protein
VFIGAQLTSGYQALEKTFFQEVKQEDKGLLSETLRDGHGMNQ